MSRIFPPVYKIKIIALDGSVITSDLPASAVQFTERLSQPGRQALGSFSIELLPARGPNAHYLLLYQQLDYHQRVEIYENVVTGQPVFAGQIVDLPANLERGGSLSGEEWLNRLRQRKLRHFEFIGGEAARNFDSRGQAIVLNSVADQLDYLLKTWQPTWRENFNDGIGGEWTTEQGGWSTALLDGYTRLQSTAAASILSRADDLNGEQSANFRLQVDMLAAPEAEAWSRTIHLFRGAAGSWSLATTSAANSDETLFVLSQGSETIQRTASYWEAPPGEWLTVELWCYDDDSAFAEGQTVEVWLNGRQFLLLTTPTRAQGGTMALEAAQDGAYFDNVILWTLEPELSGIIENTAVTDDTEWPGDTQLQALSALCDLVDYEWRTTARAGAGNDIIEIAESAGDDVSAAVRFEEGRNLVSLSLSPSGQGLVTFLKFKGQGDAANQRLAEAYDFESWDKYGIIEDDVSDNRISTNALARRKCENELVRRKDGQASLSATVLETVLTAGKWRVGDYVWIKTTEPDLNRLARVVEVTYTTNNPLRQVVFDSFPRSRSGNIGRLMDDVGKINRGKKGNTAQTTLRFAPGSRWVDDTHPAINYLDGDGSGQKWQSWTGGLAEGAWGATLHGTSVLESSARFGFWGSSIAVIARTGPNLVDADSGTYLAATVDDSAAENVGMYSANNIDRVKVWEADDLEPGYHSLSLSRAGDDDLNIYISLDAFLLGSHYWPIFVEGRAVNAAVLSWQNSKPSGYPIRLKINGLDRTAALGGPWAGNVDKLDILAYLSTPGQHSLEFVYVDENDAGVGAVVADQDTAEIEAALVLTVFL